MNAVRRGSIPIRAFSLIELLAVMGILVLLAVLTAVGVGRISKEARVSTAVNRISAVLGNARAIAIRENQVVMVVFRVYWPTVAATGGGTPDPCALTTRPANPAQRQTTEVVTAIYTGDAEVFFASNNPGVINLAGRFVLVDDVAPVRLPAGIKVAAPDYDIQNFPNLGFYNPLEEPPFMTQGEMASFVNGCRERPDQSKLIGVMFGPSGGLISRLPSATSGDATPFVDFNRIRCDADEIQDVDFRFAGGCQPALRYLFYTHPLNETNVYAAPFLVVYDDDAAREQKTLDWSNLDNMMAELTGPRGFIALFGERMSFNPVTGVVQR